MSGCCGAPPAADPTARQPSRITTGPSQSVTLDPPAEAWATILRTDPVDRESLTFRQQLALPADRPIVMAGHQPGFWHAGILAKLLAANALARRTDAAVAWLVVDQDEGSPSHMPLPALDDRGRLRRLDWSATPGIGGLPLAMPARTPQRPELPKGWTLPDAIVPRIDAIIDALRAHKDAPNAAVQHTRAAFDLLAPAVPTPRVVYASDMVPTDLFASLLERIAKRPQPVHSLFNDATAQHLDAGVRPLRTDGDSVELPISRLDRGNRVPVYDRDLAHTPSESILPRGLLMSGLARLAACDLFVHGTGGRAYEPINDRWLGRWLDRGPDAELAPFVTATADAYLDFAGEPVTADEAAEAAWRAHHARHHPAETDDPARQAERDRLVAAIAAAPRKSAERARLFDALQSLLNEHRRAHADDLGTLAQRAETLAQAASDHDVRTDRTWAAVLHDPATLASLRDTIDARFE